MGVRDGVCGWVQHVYFTGMTIYAPPNAPEQALRFTQLDSSGDVVGEPLAGGTFLMSEGCPDTTGICFVEGTGPYNACVNDNSCTMLFLCPDLEVDSIDGYCALVDLGGGWYTDCGRISNDVPCESSWWDWLFGGSGGWMPEAATSWAAFETCDANDPLTTAGGCGEEDETTCFPLCGGAF